MSLIFIDPGHGPGVGVGVSVGVWVMVGVISAAVDDGLATRAGIFCAVAVGIGSTLPSPHEESRKETMRKSDSGFIECLLYPGHDSS